MEVELRQRNEHCGEDVPQLLRTAGAQESGEVVREDNHLEVDHMFGVREGARGCTQRRHSCTTHRRVDMLKCNSIYQHEQDRPLHAPLPYSSVNANPEHLRTHTDRHEVRGTIMEEVDGHHPSVFSAHVS